MIESGEPEEVKQNPETKEETVKEPAEEEAKPELTLGRLGGAVKEGFKETLRTKAAALLGMSVGLSFSTLLYLNTRGVLQSVVH